MLNEKKILTIDLGSNTIRAGLTLLKGERREHFVSEVPSIGIKGGNIINPTSVKESLQEALNKLKMEASVQLPQETYLLVPGGATLGLEAEAENQFPMKTITHNDVNLIKKKIVETVKKRVHLSQPNLFEVIHILPEEFKVGNVDGIQNPIGHTGNSLSMRAFVILLSKSYLETAKKILGELGLKLKGAILQSLAAFYEVRDENVYYNNNLFLYLGAGNTELFYFRDDVPVFFKHEPFGSEDIIDFIVKTLKVGRKEAERLFYGHGSAYALSISPEEMIDVNYGTKTLKLQKQILSALIHIKLKELIKGIKRSLDNADPSFIGNLSRIYLAGGLAGLKDINLLFEKLLKVPVITVSPHYTSSNLSFFPIEGVVNYVLSLEKSERLTDVAKDLTKDFGKTSWWTSIWKFITQYI
jgi:cell division protein FtsA